MKGTVLYGAGDVRFEDVPEPKIIHPTDAIIKLSATCICGSDLWPYRGLNKIDAPMRPRCTKTARWSSWATALSD